MVSIQTKLKVLFLGAVVSCAPLLAQTTTNDYDHTFAFNKVKSYSYGKVQATDPLVEPRIIAALDRVLQGYGLHLVSKNPDVVIDAVSVSGGVGEYTKFYNGLTGVSWQRGWGSGGFSDSAMTLETLPLGTLVVDMYTPGGKLVWRGMATEGVAVKEKKNEDNVDKGVNGMLAKFPPKSGGPTAPNQTSVTDSPSSSTPTTTH